MYGPTGERQSSRSMMTGCCRSLLTSSGVLLQLLIKLRVQPLGKGSDLPWNLVFFRRGSAQSACQEDPQMIGAHVTHSTVCTDAVRVGALTRRSQSVQSLIAELPPLSGRIRTGVLSFCQAPSQSTIPGSSDHASDGMSLCASLCI